MINAREYFGFPKIELIDDFVFRNVVFGVVFDFNKNIGIYVVNENPYVLGLPGGGIENNETQGQALQRECFEELGIEIKVQNKLFDYEAVFSKEKGYRGSMFVCKLLGEKSSKKIFRENGRERVVRWVSCQEFIQNQEARLAESRGLRGLIELKAVKDALALLE